MVMPTAQFILLGMLIAQLADAITFAIGINRLGIDAEANAWAAMVFHSAGLDGVLMAKAAAIVVIIGLLVLAAHRFPRLLFLGGAAATSVGLLGFAANTMSILLLS
jgi:hypothetical protein